MIEAKDFAPYFGDRASHYLDAAKTAMARAGVTWSTCTMKVKDDHILITGKDRQGNQHDWADYRRDVKRETAE